MNRTTGGAVIVARRWRSNLSVSATTRNRSFSGSLPPSHPMLSSPPLPSPLPPTPPSVRTMSTSGALSSVSCYFEDVWRTKKLSPPNPFLESLPSSKDAESTTNNGTATTKTKTTTAPPEELPDFSVLRPHHLVAASQEISRQHDVDLAQMEVRWTSDGGNDATGGTAAAVAAATATTTTKPSLGDLLLDLDRLRAPVAHLGEVSDLYVALASPPDKIRHWKEASEAIQGSFSKHAFLEKLYRSRIVYRALASASKTNTTATTATTPTTPTTTNTPSFLVPFLKRGAHIGTRSGTGSGDADADRENLRELQQELIALNDRLDKVVSYDRASKATRLRSMSDMYNCIGLSRLQAESLVNNDFSDGNAENKSNALWKLARLQHNHVVVSPREQLLDTLFPEIASFLEDFLPTQTKLDLDGVGAFLEGKSEVGNSGSAAATARTELLKARHGFKRSVRLHGVVKGLVDFCEAILGITIVEENENGGGGGGETSGGAGWSKNVRLLHLYRKAGGESGRDAGVDHRDAGSEKGDYLGTIYFDPFADSYWRTDEAKHLVTSGLLGKNQATGQTVYPVAYVALRITPIWDDTPVPVAFGDTRDLLHHFGVAIQSILARSRQKRNYERSRATDDPRSVEPAPIDTSLVLAHFLELWLQNDGFVNRLAQLSSDGDQKNNYDVEETMKILRGDLRNEKALELTNTMFLSALQFEVFESFDPRGDETLVALQERLAVRYLPGSNLPDPTDLSPLLAVFQESGADQKMSAYGTLWSEVIAAMLYERFQTTDLRDRKEVERLGRGIRDLFLREELGGSGGKGRLFSEADVVDLCRKKKTTNDGNDADTAVATTTTTIATNGAAALRKVYGFGADDGDDGNPDPTNTNGPGDR